MGRSTFEGPILAGDNRFGPLRNVGYPELYQYANLTLTNTTNIGLIWNEANNTVGVDATQNTNITTAQSTATGAFIQANAAFIQANSVYANHNVTVTYANSAYSTSGLAYSQANSAQSFANSNYILITGSVYPTLNVVYALANTNANTIANTAANVLVDPLNVCVAVYDVAALVTGILAPANVVAPVPP